MDLEKAIVAHFEVGCRVPAFAWRDLGEI